MGMTISISGIPESIKNQVEAELPSRAARAENALKNAANEVLRGQRSGRRYGNHQASAPGEPPANWHGGLREGFQPMKNDAHKPGLKNTANYAMMLEQGSGKLAARPFRQKIIDMAKPEIEAIYNEPWHLTI